MVVITESENMFWGVTVEAGKKYSQTVAQGFHLSMAALESKSDSKDELVQVLLQHESSDYLICTLQHGKLLQQPLDLVFETGEQVAFSLNGSGVVHLTGYLLKDEDDYDEDDIEELESEDDAVPDLVPIQSSKGKRKLEAPGTKSKKIKLLTDDGDMEDDSDEEDDEDYEVGDDDDDEDDDDDDEEEEEEEEDFSDDFSEEDFEDDDEDEEDEDDDEKKEEEEKDISSKKKSKTPDTPQSSKKKNQENKTPQQNVKSPKVVKTPKVDKSPKGENTPKANKSSGDKKAKSDESRKETPKQAVKMDTPKAKPQNSSTPATPITPMNGEGDVTSAKKKKKKKNKSESEKPGNDTSLNKSKSETSSPAAQNTPKKRVVAGGTVVEDLKIGHGPEAKKGKMVGVYYAGKLAKNNKQFDSCSSGKPFRFRLGQGEVIKGWDNGVAGMKVGGKRRITVPASQGYGNTRQGPIPANSTLSFEVELKAVT